jgi:hypothetical protein
MAWRWRIATFMLNWSSSFGCECMNAAGKWKCGSCDGQRSLLPVWHCGQLRVVSWGSRTGRLPRSGLTWQRAIDEGGWEPYEAEPVEIRASLGHDGGVWYRIRQGIRGLLVEKAQETAAYLIVEPASHYYKVMTRRERMPVLIGERI